MSTESRSSARQVDQGELRFNSSLVIAVLVTAFITDRWQLVAFHAGVMFLTALHLSLGPYVLLYRAVLRRAGLVRPDLRPDNPEPHRFAAMIGTIVASSGAYLLATGRTVAGWGVVWLLISLATAAVAGWCAGCFTYYAMNRLGLRAVFRYGPIAGTFPGSRPPKA
jgi:hypothetical protein